MREVLPRKQAFRLVMLQALIAVIIATLWLISGWKTALSAILGGIAVVLPSGYFAYRFFSVMQASKIERIISAFYWGELTKILLTGLLTLIFVKIWPELMMIPFFCDFMGAYLVFWLAPFVIKNR